MKIRTSFVTNSSSSSYTCIAKVDYCDALKEYMKEEFGRYGLRLIEENLIKGEDVDPHDGCDYIDEYFADNLDDLDKDAYYLEASFIEWTNDGDTEGEDAWLWRHIPTGYMKVIAEEEHY